MVQRVGQDIFRSALMQYWKGKCPLTGITDPDLLRASHIVAWADCETDAKRLDVHNGLLLSALWDAAFDQGLVSFADDGSLLLSTKLSKEARQALSVEAVQPLFGLTQAHRDNLALHRMRHGFRKEQDQMTNDSRPQLGVLAFGSLITDPGRELGPTIAARIKVQTPFGVEYGRLSQTRGGGPTLVQHPTGGPVDAEILVLDHAALLAVKRSHYPWAAPRPLVRWSGLQRHQRRPATMRRQYEYIARHRLALVTDHGCDGGIRIAQIGRETCKRMTRVLPSPPYRSSLGYHPVGLPDRRSRKLWW